VWEYATLWHKARWPERSNSRYITRDLLEPAGWEQWVVTPATSDVPPPECPEIEALNFMGRLGWELVHMETIVEMPPGIDNKRYGQSRHQYFFKRRLPERLS